ncbi:MAG: hypothetical protein UY48_C0006G0015 [Candidatus Gottesmanbacteria bacterium GW2011_GWB1_49_7]|uniref:Uncharacterized protein n=1 Tax=Candidatus Gottesmanbacteria bacterium GW2011_GWB1_49_7 TaxID=1618448 RepID=A0A0G1YDA3_9BACT|nr:MAG: hypothetical protein UY48_C0006G0015 [Candidatus Gottesmanbacteria bacterium GW2011_GWB1_49_7]
MKLEFMTVKIAIRTAGSHKTGADVVDSCNEHFRALRDAGAIVDWCYNPDGIDGHETVEAPEPYVEDSVWFL